MLTVFIAAGSLVSWRWWGMQGGDARRKKEVFRAWLAFSRGLTSSGTGPSAMIWHLRRPRLWRGKAKPLRCRGLWSVCSPGKSYYASGGWAMKKTPDCGSHIDFAVSPGPFCVGTSPALAHHWVISVMGATIAQSTNSQVSLSGHRDTLLAIYALAPTRTPNGSAKLGFVVKLCSAVDKLRSLVGLYSDRICL